MKRSDLEPYQEKAVAWLNDGYRGALFADMGTGKTIITLTHLVDVAAECTLVVSTKRVVDMVWEQEAGEWDHVGHLTFTNITGTAKQREAALQQDSHIYLINVENFPWLMKQENLPPFTTLVLDELSLWGGMKVRWKSARPFAKEISSVIALTGTPAANGYMKLWPMMELVQPALLHRTKTQYKQRYFYAADPDGHVMVLRPGAKDEIHTLMREHVYRISNENLGMPQLVERAVPVDFPAEASSMSAELLREGILTLPDGTELVAETEAVRLIKGHQIANGFVYGDNGYTEIHRKKLEAAREMVDDMNGAQVIIAYWYQHEFAELQREFRKEAITLDDPDAVELWNSGRAQVLLLHPASGGHGLNLQKSKASQIIWFSLTWDLDKYQQTNARLARRGGASTVFAHQLVCGSLDRRIARALREKESVQEALLKSFT